MENSEERKGRGRGRLVLNKLAYQQRTERGTLARKKKDGSWRAPKHRSRGNEGTNSGRNVIYTVCTSEERETKGAAQKAKRERRAWEQELGGGHFQNKHQTVLQFQ